MEIQLIFCICNYIQKYKDYGNTIDKRQDITS